MAARASLPPAGAQGAATAAGALRSSLPNAASWVPLGTASSPPVVQTLVAHVAAQDAAVGSKAGDGDAHVVVDLEDLRRGQHRMGAGATADGAAAVWPWAEACPFRLHIII